MALYKEGQMLIALLQALTSKDLIQKLADRKVTAFSMDMVPRIARAQKLDALSSQSNVAGYKSVLMAANHVGKMMPMMMTAAGTHVRIGLIGNCCGLECCSPVRSRSACRNYR